MSKQPWLGGEHTSTNSLAVATLRHLKHDGPLARARAHALGAHTNIYMYILFGCCTIIEPHKPYFYVYILYPSQRRCVPARLTRRTIVSSTKPLLAYPCARTSSATCRQRVFASAAPCAMSVYGETGCTVSTTNRNTCRWIPYV